MLAPLLPLGVSVVLSLTHQGALPRRTGRLRSNDSLSRAGSLSRKLILVPVIFSRLIAGASFGGVAGGVAAAAA